MPGKLITDPAEWERLTGSRGSVYIGPAPARRPKRHEVFLCPHCLETLTSPRSGILRCAPCNKTWERETGQEVFCRVPRKCANSFEFKADITTGRLSALGQKQTYAVQIVMSALPPIATLVAYFHEGAACCASATADQICARSKVVPSRWIERDYLSVSSLHRRTIWVRGCHPARYRWRPRFIWARIAHRQASCFTRCLSFCPLSLQKSLLLLFLLVLRLVKVHAEIEWERPRWQHQRERVP
jgi:hypothetical protein